MFCCNKRKLKTTENYYRPNFRNKALTEKFYARHESFDFDSNLLKSPDVQKYVQLISEYRKRTTQSQSLAPITENQRYGWLIDLAIQPKDEMDSSLLNYPRKVDSQLKLIAVISAAKK